MMRIPTHADAFEVLCLQAADQGRGSLLFGESLTRARKLARPFMVGEGFPSVYLEFPLVGDPFLDVTVLYDKLEPKTRVASIAAAGSEAMLDWYAEVGDKFGDVCCGFELDTKQPELPCAAVHFQPREHLELVRPFCEALGEQRRAELYLGTAARMPEDWRLSFFGFFRGRSGSPLRVCGYLDRKEAMRCARDSAHIAEVFDEVGFAAYDETMLERAAVLMEAAPDGLDFQFDVLDDGTLGSMFALDLRLGVMQPEDVVSSFEDGQAARVFGLLEGYGAADGRWRLAGKAAFARSVNVVLEDGGIGRYAFTLTPQWVKARWCECTQQPSKLYHFAHAGLL